METNEITWFCENVDVTMKLKKETTKRKRSWMNERSMIFEKYAIVN